jgi:tetratricopeptide (TPR) repeat protein
VRRPGVGSPFGVLFAFYLLAFLFFLVRGIFTFPSRELLGLFLWPYVWSEAFLQLMRYAIPLTLAGTAVAYSLLYRPAGAGRRPFFALLSSNLAGQVSLAVVFTGLFLGLEPWVATNRGQLFSLSAQARTYLSQAESAMDTGDERSALLSYERYLAVNPGDEEIQSRASQLRALLYTGSEAPAQQQELRLTPKDLAEGLSPPELIRMAERFLADGDYFTAYYYADLAVRIDPRRADARRLAARAQEMIRSFAPNEGDDRMARVFDEKRRGFDLYRKGEYVQSYRVFHALRQEYPRDLEVQKYYDASRAQLASLAFFLDEARAAEAMPGPERLLFLNRRQEEIREVVYLGKMSSTPEGVFFADIEVAGFTPRRLLYHYGAPFGKLYEGQINLRGIDRREPKVETGVVVYEGALSKVLDDVPEMLTLAPDPAVLPALRSESCCLDSLSLFALWRVRARIGDYGHLPAPVGMEVLRRVMTPFVFLVLALVGMSAGLRFRADSRRRPRWPVFLLVPAFPLVAVYVASFYVSAQRVILGFILVRSGFAAALGVMLALQAVALFLALIALAGQRGE